MKTIDLVKNINLVSNHLSDDNGLFMPITSNGKIGDALAQFIGQNGIITTNGKIDASLRGFVGQNGKIIGTNGKSSLYVKDGNVFLPITTNGFDIPDGMDLKALSNELGWIPENDKLLVPTSESDTHMDGMTERNGVVYAQVKINYEALPGDPDQKDKPKRESVGFYNASSGKLNVHARGKLNIFT